MQDIFGSVRRSLVFRSPDGGGEEGTLADKISSCIRKSRAFSKPSPPLLPPPPTAIDSASPAPPIRWRKGELIGCGAFGQVYMGMNLDSGELLAVKQVLIAANHASKEKAQAHIKELEEEVKLLKNLSHPNIVRYLGTVREEETLNILLEFVPGGSISSLLGKFGSFPEAVIRMYTKQLLLGLDYLHKNGIMHRDIKGANILVDNKGCIKLADFGASKQVVELATISGAKSMKGTPYWMAPEVILQTGHSFSADIWSVGCTVIEMATGKPPWSQQYQEVAALFHIGTTKSHPPIPEHLSVEAKDFLLKCLHKYISLIGGCFLSKNLPKHFRESKRIQPGNYYGSMEPGLRPAASDLLQHPFVAGKLLQSDPFVRTSSMVSRVTVLDVPINPDKLSESTHLWRANKSDRDMCQIDDKDDLMSSNPVCEPSDDWKCKADDITVLEQRGKFLENDRPIDGPAIGSGSPGEGANGFSFPSGPSLSEDDDEVTESKIRAFLVEKAIELKKLQTPLYEEFYNSLNASCSPNFAETTCNESALNYLKLPPKSRSPSQAPVGSPSTVNNASPGSGSTHMCNVHSASNQSPQDTSSPQQEQSSPWLVLETEDTCAPYSANFSEIQKKWKEELDQELERKREMMRQAGGGKSSSPKDRGLNRPRDRSRFASPGK
ncbi:hypothetical protein RJ640_024795 [Escallonia rubra]|uniref:mitogen-activated protein kinase kinase kinase n=1 Tax=Escallonia rubra TaxID=112253 RepID=A0AA88UI45_9ASTE|nr:hypothetical protein RJ640_024795 [Escallonia rubra]